MYTGAAELRASRPCSEKRVDVSLAIDLVQATHQQSYDGATVVSQNLT